MPCDSGGWGSDSDVYERLDELVRYLCEVLPLVPKDSMSPRLRRWWRDHQAIDRERKAKERDKRERSELRSKVLKKLTKAERRALGIRDVDD